MPETPAHEPLPDHRHGADVERFCQRQPKLGDQHTGGNPRPVKQREEEGESKERPDPEGAEPARPLECSHKEGDPHDGQWPHPHRRKGREQCEPASAGGDGPADHNSSLRRMPLSAARATSSIHVS